MHTGYSKISSFTNKFLYKQEWIVHRKSINSESPAAPSGYRPIALSKFFESKKSLHRINLRSKRFPVWKIYCTEIYQSPKLMKSLWFPHQKWLAFTEIVSLRVFSLKIHLLSITLPSTRLIIYNLGISGMNKGFTCQFWPSASSQLFQWFYLALTE